MLPYERKFKKNFKVALRIAQLPLYGPSSGVNLSQSFIAKKNNGPDSTLWSAESQTNNVFCWSYTHTHTNLLQATQPTISASCQFDISKRFNSSVFMRTCMNSTMSRRQLAEQIHFDWDLEGSITPFRISLSLACIKMILSRRIKNP